MPSVPQIPNKQLKTIYNPINPYEPASMKQKNYIMTLCERRKIDTPNLKTMTKGEAAQLISNLTSTGVLDA